LALVGDFGGTNVRLALADISSPTPVIANVRHYHSKEFAQAADTIEAYVRDTAHKPTVAVIAAAGPVKAGTVRFTNLGWSLSESDLKSLSFTSAAIVNDFVAAAFATRLLGESDLHRIGPAATGGSGNVAVIGPGTGFGASALIIDSGVRPVAVAAEGGHASFAPDDPVEIDVLRILMSRFGHVSIERLLSGSGLCSLHAALNSIEGVSDPVDDAEVITARALADNPLSLRTVDRFCAILGGTAGNIALTYGALGGVYIAGGIAPGILPILDRSPFRARFEAKGRFADYLRAIPTSVITRPDAAFLGAAYVARTLPAA
jgi:glucokinase